MNDCEKCGGRGTIPIHRWHCGPYTTVTARICDCEAGDRYRRCLRLMTSDTSTATIQIDGFHLDQRGAWIER